MPFEKKTPTWDNGIFEYKSGKITVVCLAYLLGQHRLQIWCDNDGISLPGWEPLPDILPPEF